LIRADHQHDIVCLLAVIDRSIVGPLVGVYECCASIGRK